VEETAVDTAQGVDVIADPKTIPSAGELAASMAAGAMGHGESKSARTGAICSSCGSSNMRRAGACHVCGDCGSTSGCS
ncbi:MAG: hypothetical protein ACO4A3_06065, partial [Ilumatobacteraceae bacterium]